MLSSFLLAFLLLSFLFSISCSFRRGRYLSGGTDLSYLSLCPCNTHRQYRLFSLFFLFFYFRCCFISRSLIDEPVRLLSIDYLRAARIQTDSSYMTRKTTVSPMEDYKYSLDAADSREHLHLGYDNDETLPTGLLLSSSLHESGTSLGEEIRRRSSSSNNTASWEFLRGEGSCSRAHECSPEILRVMGSNESSMGDGKQSPSQYLSCAFTAYSENLDCSDNQQMISCLHRPSSSSSSSSLHQPDHHPPP